MDLNEILEIGSLYNVKVENTHTKQIEKRNLLIFIFSDNTTHYLDIDAGRELTEYERVVANNKTKIDKLYQSQKINIEEFKANHPNLDIKIEDGILKANKINKI